jgi:hypothetical protein
MQNIRSRPAPGSSRRTVLMSLGLFGLMMVGLIGIWWTAAMKTPVVTIPNPVMPTPNAFDFYIRASNAVVKEKQIGDAASTIPTTPFSMAQKEALVQQNAGVINTLHQGFAYPYLNPPVRAIYAPLPYYAKFRGVARLLSLRGQVCAARGDWNGATDSYLDAIRMGEDMPHGSILIGEMVGIACQAIGRRPLWSAVDHLIAARSRAAAARLAGIMDRHFSYADTLQEEKWYGQSSRVEVFDDPKKRDALFLTNEEAKDPEAVKGASLSAYFYLFYSKGRVMRDFTRYMDAVSAQVRRPYATRLPPPAEPQDPINQAMMADYLYGWYKDVQNQTQNRLLLVALALHAYRLEHGRYPASLTELAPGYLKALPDDPCAVEGTFPYRLKGKSYVLYSVGPDGKDDGGKPIDDPKNASPGSPKSRYRVDRKSQGDIVAGINTR